MKRKLFVPISFLTAVNAQKEKTVHSFLYRDQQKSKPDVERKNIDGRIHVDYYSFPDSFITKHQFPPKSIAASIYEEWKSEQRQKQSSNDLSPVQKDDQETLYVDAYNAKTEFPLYRNQLRDRFATVPADKLTEFAKEIAVAKWILDNVDGSPATAVNIWNRLFPSNTKVYGSMCNFLRKCKADGVEATVIDKRCLHKVDSRISDFQYTFIRTLYTQSQKNSARATHSKLVEACKQLAENPYSLASVKIYFRKFENNPELYRMRYGQGAAQKQLPYASLAPAQHILTLVHMDGKTMPFWSDKFQRYTLFYIIDNHSQKIISYQVGKSENTELITAALDDMISTTGYFPNEIIADNHSFHKTQIATRLKEETEKLGATWTITMNPQYNSRIERNNQYFDEIWKDCKGYTGSINKKLSPEEYETLAKSKNWCTEAEIKIYAAYAVKKYNETALTALQGISPNEAWEQSEPLKAFKVTEADRLRLMRPVTRYKVTRGQITIKIGSVKHEFQLPAALIDRYNNQYVEVVYEDLYQGVYISDEKEGVFESLSPKRKIHIAKADQTGEDRTLLNKHAGRMNGTITRARKSEAEKLTEALKANPDAIDLINELAMEKDARKIAAESRDMQRYANDLGVNKDHLPIRNEAPVLVPIMVGQPEKNNSPFLDRSHSIKPLTEAELYGYNSNDQ